jgi:hypothetical protein
MWLRLLSIKVEIVWPVHTDDRSRSHCRDSQTPDYPGPHPGSAPCTLPVQFNLQILYLHSIVCTSPVQLLELILVRFCTFIVQIFVQYCPPTVQFHVQIFVQYCASTIMWHVHCTTLRISCSLAIQILVSCTVPPFRSLYSVVHLLVQYCVHPVQLLLHCTDLRNGNLSKMCASWRKYEKSLTRVRSVCRKRYRTQTLKNV